MFVTEKLSSIAWSIVFRNSLGKYCMEAYEKRKCYKYRREYFDTLHIKCECAKCMSPKNF